LSDIFREVEEDVRRERLEKIWKAYRGWFIALAVLVLAAVAGWQLWQRHELAERTSSGDAYVAAQRISDPANAAKAFAELAGKTKGAYGLLAKMSQANAMSISGQGRQAVDLYKEIGEADSGDLGAVARLRAAWVQASFAPRGQLETLLAPLDKDGSAWRPLAREVLAFSDYRAAKVKQAASQYHALADDPNAPDALRTRARTMAAFLDSGAGGDTGTVPAAAPPVPPPAIPVPAAPAK
jgi:hypothetical protein